MRVNHPSRFIFVVVGFLLTIAVGFIVGRAIAGTSTPAQAQPNPPDSSILTQDLAQEGWLFNPVSTGSSPQPGVALLTKDQAIAKANNIFPDFQKSPDLTGISANIGELSNSRMQQSAQRGEKVNNTFLKPKLVWIVSYEGIKMPSAGPAGSNISMSTEMNVVIDAVSGDYLMDYVWTR